MSIGYIKYYGERPINKLPTTSCCRSDSNTTSAKKEKLFLDKKSSDMNKFILPIKSDSKNKSGPNSMPIIKSTNGRRKFPRRKKKRFFYWEELKQTMHYLPLGSTFDTNTEERIIFNRVPKCGSRTVLDIFKYLANRNQYNMISSTIYGPLHLPENKKALIKELILAAEPPVLFQRHMHFLSFPNSSRVRYINIIRDPIDRFISEYYFIRFGDDRNPMNFSGTDQEKYQTINECVLKRRPECSGNRLQYIIPFFCGHNPQCSLLNSSIPLEMAKTNIQQSFVTLGLLDEIEDTFAVLEKALPRLFQGATAEIVRRQKQKKNKQFQTKSKVMPTEEVNKILLKEMYWEYQLYDYVKERLKNQKKTLGIKR
ncbi:uronyl 2-sulfotransferase-like [Antedon mediterranea]|uniref:uronyl 2-sulfotransferase-like n=1 Tax=Antedon mediterranea TaxID=105859 RepID=UPI003AF6BC69